MPSGEGRGRTSATEKTTLIGRGLDHGMVPKMEISGSYVTLMHLQNPIYAVRLF